MPHRVSTPHVQGSPRYVRDRRASANIGSSGSAALSRQLCQSRLGLQQVGRIKALGEPALACAAFPAAGAPTSRSAARSPARPCDRYTTAASSRGPPRGPWKQEVAHVPCQVRRRRARDAEPPPDEVQDTFCAIKANHAKILGHGTCSCGALVRITSATPCGAATPRRGGVGPLHECQRMAYQRKAHHLPYPTL
jgi:hypothetical protein